jgi:hypothetical protein
MFFATVSRPSAFALGVGAFALLAGRLWCKRHDLARYDVGRAAGGAGMGKLMGVEQLFEGRSTARSSSSACAGIFASS